MIDLTFLRLKNAFFQKDYSQKTGTLYYLFFQTDPK